MSNKPVCLIGGGGFIGTRYRRHLAKRGTAAVVLGRSPATRVAADEIHINVEEQGWDTAREILAAHEYSVIVDLAYASVPNSSFSDPARDAWENLGGVLRHLDLCSRLKADRFIYVSSGGTVYGEGSGRPLREEDPVFPLSPYGITKLACERYVYLHHRLHGLPAVIARPSNIYGPGQIPFRGQGIVSTGFGSAFQGRPVSVFGDGATVRDYLHVDDFCDALDALSVHAQPGTIVNVGCGEGTRTIDLLQRMKRLMEEHGGDLALEFKAPRPFDVQYNVLDISRLQAIAPWRPRVSLDDGLTETRDWVERFLTDRSSPS